MIGFANSTFPRTVQVTRTEIDNHAVVVYDCFIVIGDTRDPLITTEVIIVCIECVINRVAHLQAFKFLFWIDLTHHLVDGLPQAPAVIVKACITIFDVEEATPFKIVSQLSDLFGRELNPRMPRHEEERIGK